MRALNMMEVMEVAGGAPSDGTWTVVWQNSSGLGTPVYSGGGIDYIDNGTQCVQYIPPPPPPPPTVQPEPGLISVAPLIGSGPVGTIITTVNKVWNYINGIVP